MDVETVDVRLELIERVETALLCAPVEPVMPVHDQLLQISEVHPIGPARTRQLVREARSRKPVLQIRQDGILDVDLERNEGAAGRRTRGGA